MITPGNDARSKFPFFSHYDRGKGCAYLDSASSSQKPLVVIERLSNYLSFQHANVHRGAYELSANATEAYDEARAKIQRFINAKSLNSIVFTKGTTESINLVSNSYGKFIGKDSVVLLTLLEHHSNIVPWHMLAKRSGARIEFVQINQDTTLNMEDFISKLKALKPKLVSVTHISNVLGTVVPVAQIVSEAHKVGAKVLIDAAQSVPHGGVDVTALDCDFLVFSGHKAYGPTGVGVLYAKEELLQMMDPYQGGGGMIQTVTTEGATWAEPPQKFEAGTPPIAEAVALGEAIDFIQQFKAKAIVAHEEELLSYALSEFSKRDYVNVYGPGIKNGHQRSIVSFNIRGVHPHDVATVVDECGAQLRSGHHCAMPLLHRLGIDSTARVSFGVYNTKNDVDILIGGIEKVKKVFC